jgi:hypothetical protein
MGAVKERLVQYIAEIVEPTFAELERNPASKRHAFLACATTYHAIDRVSYPKRPGNLRKRWGEQSREFLMVDLVTHHFKHVRNDDERKPMSGRIPITPALIGAMGFNTAALGGFGQKAALRNLVFVVRDAVRFLHRKAGELP